MRGGPLPKPRRRTGFCLLLSGILSAAAAFAQPQSTFTVFLDAAHGGADSGAILAPQLLEKNLVLTLSVRLRSALTARGFTVITARESDADPTEETRAAEANHAHPDACLVLHATASGAGVHLYTSSLAQAPPASGATGALTPWATAGAPFETAGLKLASTISSALTADGLPFTIGRVRLAPLDFLRCPAVAVEVAPLHPIDPNNRGGSAKLSDPAYQRRLVEDLAAALVEWRGESPAGGAR